MARLKVYRTPIGFHDAYVAAPSQKAALEAWGSDANLFARGIAEVVTDTALTKEPLTRPGEVIKRLRGTAAEQIAALPPDPKRPSKRGRAASGAPVAKPAAKREPAPDRSAVESAERALILAEEHHRADLKELDRRQADLATKRRTLEKEQAAQNRVLLRARDRAQAAYDRAVRKWRG